MYSNENSLDHIIDKIWVGSHNAAKDLDLLQQYHIKAILSLEIDSRYAQLYPEDWKYLHLEQHDGSPIPDTYFERAFEFIKFNHENDINMLVHCTVGVSRSPSMVSAYLMDTYGYNPVKTLKFLKSKRPQVFPARACFQSAIDYVYPDKTWRCQNCGKIWEYRTFSLINSSRGGVNNTHVCSCQQPVLV